MACPAQFIAITNEQTWNVQNHSNDMQKANLDCAIFHIITPNVSISTEWKPILSYILMKWRTPPPSDDTSQHHDFQKINLDPRVDITECWKPTVSSTWKPQISSMKTPSFQWHKTACTHLYCILTKLPFPNFKDCEWNSNFIVLNMNNSIRESYRLIRSKKKK